MSDEEPIGFTPFDLQAPARLIYPVYSSMRGMDRDVTAIDIGHSAGEGRFTIVRGNDGEVSAWVKVPCEAMSHGGCRYCECEDSHVVYFTEGQLRALREMLLT